MMMSMKKNLILMTIRRTNYIMEYWNPVEFLLAIIVGCDVLIIFRLWFMAKGNINLYQDDDAAIYVDKSDE